MSDQSKTKTKKQPGLLLSLLPIIILVIALIFIVGKYEQDPHIPIIIGAITATIIAMTLGYTWKDIEDGMINTIGMGMQSMLILMIIGAIIGSWILGGVVPTLIYYGIQILSPEIFLVASCLISAVVSISTGSSWTTAGTVGIALIGIGGGIGVPLPMVAGAVVSGAYFGDKMSPLSDTTNLAPAMAGSNLFDHIRHMIKTTGPSLLIALIIYGIIGTQFAGSKMNANQVKEILATLQANFNIDFIMVIPPLLVISLVIFKVPAIPGLIGGAILGAILAVFFQGADLLSVVDVLQNGFVSKTGNEIIDTLLTRGGIQSMMWTISLILCALSFGGVLEATGMLEVIAENILKLAVNTGALVTATVLTCILFNILASDQYLSIVIPGRMYRNAYLDLGLDPVNLSRTLEDSGTLTSALVPWNTCGGTMAAFLGVKTVAYAPFAILNYLNPIVSIIYGFTGFTMLKLSDEEIAKHRANKVITE